MFAHVFINVALTLIGNRMPLKLIYNELLLLFLLGFSIAGLQNDTEAANNTASNFLEHTYIINHTFIHDYTSAHVQTLKCARQQSKEI